MEREVNEVLRKINSFKRKYYLDLFLRGVILSALILLVYYLVAAIVEYSFWLTPWARFVIFFSFFIVAGYCVYRFLREPVRWWIAGKGLSEEDSARLIGQHLPSVRDHLLNFIQLNSSGGRDSLAYASILQRTKEFEPLSFESVIDLKQNARFARYLIIPFAVFVAILLLNSSILTQSTSRIINFSTEFSPAAPFQFVVHGAPLQGYYNEDFELKISFEGSSLPNEAYIVTGNQRIKLDRQSNGVFSYRWDKLSHEPTFQVEAAGFYSSNYKVSLVRRPEINQFRIALEYPEYLRRKSEQIVNSGNLEVPEGTKITWKLNLAYTDSVMFSFGKDSVASPAKRVNRQAFEMVREMRNADSYDVTLINKSASNRDKISYNIDVIKDQHPTISVNSLKDSVLFDRILLAGSIGDDYGVSALELRYSLKDKSGRDKDSGRVPIKIHKNELQQNFFHQWVIDSLKQDPGSTLEYHLVVWDNDGVNGKKATRSASYAFAIPSQEQLMDQITQAQSGAQQKIDRSLSQSEQLQKKIEEASQKLKGKQSLNWQDKKMLEDIVQQKKALDEMIEKLRTENKMLNERKDAFTEQDKRIREKAEQIQKLMDELLDEETKRLFDELQKLLQQNAEPNELQRLLNKLNQNSSNLEKELERVLELFKNDQFEFRFDQALKDLNNQIQRQEELQEKTRELSEEQSRKSNKSEAAQQKIKDELNQLAKEQEELRNDASRNAEKIDELEKLGEELHRDNEVPDSEMMDEAINNQDKSQEQLNDGKPSQSEKSQQKALDKMRQMKQQMESAQSSSAMEMDMENLESLRQIVHSLVRLSFDQEAILKEFNELTQSDPRFNILAQRQLKLKDDSKVLEDSLLALAKRDPFMGSVITKEIGELKEHVNKAVEANKERRRPQAATEMQSSMTSINNLALMLDAHLEMMMEMMANAKPSKGKGKKKGQTPSLGQMQQQLNQKIEQLKNSGKTGKELSEELAEMAAEQERIRKAFQQMQEKLENGGSKPDGQLPGKMEQTEMELVNKQLTDQMIRRQQEILTRLLEAEKSAREQDMDDERKGETAKDYEKEIPKAFEEYLRLKEKEVELLKTVPPKLYPFYKKEVSEYFKRMGK